MHRMTREPGLGQLLLSLVPDRLVATVQAISGSKVTDSRVKTNVVVLFDIASDNAPSIPHVERRFWADALSLERLVPV